MEQYYAQAHYINDLKALIEHHQKQLLSAAAEQEAAKVYEEKLKTECDGYAEKIKEIDANEDFDSSETLEEERKQLSEKLVFRFGKLKWLRDKIQECQIKKEAIAGELHKLMMQRLHIKTVHNM